MAINGWPLFWLITAPISLLMLAGLWRLDMSTPEAVSAMIQLSVRCAVPWLYLAFAASSAMFVFRGPFSRWLLRNRKYIGLCFAAAMGWQLFFILWLTGLHTEYYVREVYVLSDVVEGVVGYLFLIAMTVTSFRPGRRRLSPKQWRLLHRTGIYWLWIYAWSVYWFNLFYYAGPPALIDYLYYWGGFAAWALRLLAWAKKHPESAGSNRALAMLGAVAIGIGLVATGFARGWSSELYAYLFSFRVVETIDAFTPYFPGVPFYPIFLMIAGAWLMAAQRAGESASA